MSEKPLDLKPGTKAFALRVKGRLARWPMDWRSSGLTGLGYCLVFSFPGPPLRVSPGFNISGFQPANLSGPKARNGTARAGANPASASHCLAFAGNRPAILPGPKARNVIAWAGVRPTHEGPGKLAFAGNRPAILSGLKARNVIARAGVRPTHEGPGKRSPQIIQAL